MTSRASSFHLIFITADPKDATLVAMAGVDRVMVDLEILGKEERQGHLDTVISRHQSEDVAIIADALRDTPATLMVRLNPLNPNSVVEIENALNAGAQRLMLPMFRSAQEVQTFLELVRGRVPVTLLLETSTALARLNSILALEGDFDLHLGLNDLHLELKLDFMFEIMSEGLADYVCHLCQKAGRDVGIGGVARLGGQGALPAELILREHQRLQSSGVILSRDWRSALNSSGDFSEDVARLRAFMVKEITSDSSAFAEAVSMISNGIAARKAEETE